MFCLFPFYIRDLQTILTSFFTSRDQGWTEELNFRCEQRKDDYAVNIMAKGKFSRDCLSECVLVNFL